MWKENPNSHFLNSYSVWGLVEQTFLSKASHFWYKACDLLKFIIGPFSYSLWQLSSTPSEEHMENRHNGTEFVLLGLTQTPEGQKVLFVAFLLIYIVTIVANLLIIVTIMASQSLGAPMYFFLAYLSFIDAVYSTVIAPKMIVDLLYEKKTISFRACMTQVFIEHLFAGAEVILLVVMTYDWYTAVCKPLLYLIIMNQWFCVVMLQVAWTAGFLHSLVQFSYLSVHFLWPHCLWQLHVWYVPLTETYLHQYLPHQTFYDS